MNLDAAAVAETMPQRDAYWRPMRYFNLYRLFIAACMVAAHFIVRDQDWWQFYGTATYFHLSLTYLAFAVTTTLMSELQHTRFDRQVSLQAIGDILLIVMLMHAAGGAKSGLGLLLVVAIVGAALVSQGRLALFFASIASIGLLLEQSTRVLSGNDRYDDYSQSVMLSLSCFATAWLAYTLGKRMRQSEALASQRGIDLENLSQVNQLIIQDMQDGVLVVDEQFILRHHNGRAEELLGVDPSSCANTTLDNCAPEVAGLMRDWIEREAENRSGIARLVSHGKELRLRFQPVSPQRRRGAVIFIEDWSRVQAQARQMKLAALGGLTANIAHEIRNPLSAISHASQLLQEEETPGADYRRLLNIIDDNTLRLDHIVQDVMQINQRDRIQQEVIQLQDFIREFRDEFCILEGIEPSRIALELNMPETVTMFDRQQLQRVLWNLCRNGWRHGSKQPGSLMLRLGRGVRKGEVMLEISDDGPGVPPEARNRLFEPFFTTEKSGTGLGLYIARELCEANGAGLRYIETPVGAQFRIYLKIHHA